MYLAIMSHIAHVRVFNHFYLKMDIFLKRDINNSGNWNPTFMRLPMLRNSLRRSSDIF